MRRFLLGCFCLFFCIYGFGESSIIHLRKKDQPVSTRSLSMIPTVSHDGCVVYIYYYYALLENLQITIKDSSENIVYSNVIDVSGNKPYSFTLDDLESGEYEIELSYGTNLLYGYFYL